MTTKGWGELHQDVVIKMSCDHIDMSLDITMADKSHAGRVVTRHIPFQALPLEQGELVLDDYLCSIFEQLYQSIKLQRSKSNANK